MAKKNEAAARHVRYSAALDKAHAAACAAQRDENGVMLKENMNAFDCGFAWVVTRDLSFNGWCSRQLKASRGADGRGFGDRKFGDNRKFGDKHYAGGWCFWSPGDFNGQAIGIKEKGARAFAETLQRELGIYAEASSRLD